MPHWWAHRVYLLVFCADRYAALWQTTRPWTMHIIRWAAENQMQNIYTNFEGKNSLCANYREPGGSLDHALTRCACVGTFFSNPLSCMYYLRTRPGLHFHGKAQGPDTKIITTWNAQADEYVLSTHTPIVVAISDGLRNWCSGHVFFELFT